MSRTIILYLLPCPRCRGPVSMYAARYTKSGTQYAISCVDLSCHVNTTFVAHKTPEEMAELWNHGVGLVREGIPYDQVPGQLMAVEVCVDD